MTSSPVKQALQLKAKAALSELIAELTGNLLSYCSPEKLGK
jgi:hypothetical protein